MSSTETLLDVASCLGKGVDASSTILDFGCGNGGKVKGLRDAGYDVYGVDVKFKSGPHVEDLACEERIRLVDLDNYRIPFPDDHFDLIFSEQVFEHVQNYDEALNELARVLKPGGVGLHRFPSRLRPLESHVKVPFSSVFRPHWWMVIWSGLALRKPSQKGQATVEVARSNREYLDRSTNYLPGCMLSRHFGERFREFGYAEACWFVNSPNRRGRVLGRVARVLPFVPWVYRTFWTRMIYHVK